MFADIAQYAAYHGNVATLRAYTLREDLQDNLARDVFAIALVRGHKEIVRTLWDEKALSEWRASSKQSVVLGDWSTLRCERAIRNLMRCAREQKPEGVQWRKILRRVRWR